MVLLGALVAHLLDDIEQQFAEALLGDSQVLPYVVLNGCQVLGWDGRTLGGVGADAIVQELHRIGLHPDLHSLLLVAQVGLPNGLEGGGDSLLVDEQPREFLGEREKWLYAGIVRSQLSWIEMVFLFYNGMTVRGEKFKSLIERYALFDNLTIESDELLVILKECPMDSTGYAVAPHRGESFGGERRMDPSEIFAGFFGLVLWYAGGTFINQPC